MSVYIVMTKFSAGIYLSKKGIDLSPYTKTARVQKTDDYEMALAKFEEWYGDVVDVRNIIPNKLYQVRDKRIYCVFCSLNIIGFVKDDNLRSIIKENELDFLRLYKRYNLTFEEAQLKVFQLGGAIGEDKGFKVAKAYEGIVYDRRSK